VVRFGALVFIAVHCGALCDAEYESRANTGTRTRTHAHAHTYIRKHTRKSDGANDFFTPEMDGRKYMQLETFMYMKIFNRHKSSTKLLFETDISESY